MEEQVSSKSNEVNFDTIRKSEVTFENQALIELNFSYGYEKRDTETQTLPETSESSTLSKIRGIRKARRIKVFNFTYYGP